MKALRWQTFSIFLEYFVWLLFGLLIWAVFKLSVESLANPGIFAIIFLYFLFLPGWLLARIFKISAGEFIANFLIYLVLGLSFFFLGNFLAIFAGVSLATLSQLFWLILILLFILALILDIFRPRAEIEIKWRDFININNLYFLLPLFLGFFICWWVAGKGVSLDGDPYLHLSIIRKAIEGNSLSPRALALTKTQLINPAYVYPVWHIFLAFMSKNLSISIFNTWSNLVVALTFLSFLSWYFLAKIIFKKISWAILALVLFMIFIFYAGPGYLFTRLGIPDTLAQLILLPLGLGLALKYIFDPSAALGASRKLLIINFLLAFILLVLHGPHYFYLIVSIFFLGIIYAATFWRDKDYSTVLLSFLKIILVQLAALILVAATIELRSHALSVAILEFYKSASGGVVFSTDFVKFGLVYKYGILLLPLSFIILILARKKELLFVIASMLLVPLIYWTPIKFLFNKTLSGVFTDRLLANTSLYFLVFALIFGTIFLAKDRFFSKLTKNMQSFLVGLLILIGFLLVILESRSQAVSNFIYQVFYAKPTNAWLNLHYWWFLGLVLAVTIIMLIIIWIKHFKIVNFEHQNHLFCFILMAILSYILISPSIVNVQAQVGKPKNLIGESYFLYLIKDPVALNFVKNLPPQSVILTTGGASKGLATLTDQYLAYNPGTSFEKKFAWVFNAANPDSAKAAIVTDPKWAIDYVYLTNSSLEGQHFLMHPELYQLVYSGQVKIYKVIK